MQPEEIAQQGVMNLAGLCILTAIPAVAFALWCDYVERFFEARLKEREPVDRTMELYRIRSAGFFVQLFQLLIFFGTTPIRREHPMIAYPLFVAAVVAQFVIQRTLEGKIRGARKKPGEPSPLTQVLRTFGWSLVAGGLYLFVMLGSVFGMTALGIAAGAPMPVKLALLVTGMAIGIAGGLVVNFALASFFVRRMMNARPVKEGELFERLGGIFNQAQLAVPPLYLVDVAQYHIASAMMAGFPTGRGIFTPGFFLSQELVDGLSEAELRSVVLHEASHCRLEHLKRRFVFSAGLIICSSLASGVGILLSRSLGAGEQEQGLIGCIALFACFLFAFRTLAQQVKYQEIAADIHSIEKLGSNLADLSSALRKLDRLNDEAPAMREPASMFASLGHPATEYRIRVLERYFQAKAGAPSQDPADGDASKAA